MLKRYKSCLICSVLFLSGCPDQPGPMPTPIVSSTPITPTPSPIGSVLPINQYTNISDSFFKVDFGPGTKGVSNLGPGSKGVNNLGPGTKGVSNLRFNVNFDPNLIRTDLPSFNVKSESPLYVNNLLMTLEKDGEKIADINVIPRTNQVTFTIDTTIKPGIYDLKAIVTNNFEPLNVTSKVELESNLELKVVLYAKQQSRKDLDISIRTKPINTQE